MVAIVAGAAGFVTRWHADPPARLHLQGGGAWVASSTVGQLTLIDGGSAEVVARARVAPPGAELRSAQEGTTGFALDRDHGTVARVDPATFDVGPAVAVIAGARGALAAYPSGDRLYLVDHDRGRVAVADAATAVTLRGRVRSLAEPVAASVVDRAGRLWTLGRRTGDLTWFDGADRGSRRAVAADPATATLAVVGGRAAVVSLGDRTSHTLDEGGGRRAGACLEVDPDDTSVRVGGSARGDRLYVVSGDDGMLRVSDLRTGACGDTAITVAPPTSQLGVPQEAQGRVFVPDYTKGTVAVVDLRTRRTVHTGELVPRGTRFELFAEDGIVFYNDPGSERAGVVAVDGSFSAVAKYDPDRPGAGLGAGGGTGVPDGDESGPPEGALGARGAGGGPGGAATPDDPAGGGRPGPSSPGAPAPAARPGAPGTGSRPPDGRGATPTPGRGRPSPGALIAIGAPAGRVAVGEPLELTARATRKGARLSDLSWDFADDTAGGTGRRVTHAWAEAGTYRVHVAGTVRPGGRATAFVDIVVLPPAGDAPAAAFDASATRVRVGEPVTFVDRTTPEPATWSWTFPGADGPGSFGDQSPPPQTWSSPGTYTVTLEVERDGRSDTATADVTIDPAPLEAPKISAIRPTPGGPYDDQTDYTFQADVTGQVTSCAWTIDGAVTPCPPSAGPVTATHRFASAGPKTVTLDVTGPGGPARQSIVVDVAHLQAPVAAILVGGATRQADGSWLGTEGSPVTFTSNTSGTVDRLDWTNGTIGATGPSWSPALAPGSYTVTLTAVSARMGNSSASVRVVIQTADPTPPVADRPVGTGTAAAIFIQATGSDPESGVTRIDVYGTYSGVCHVGGRDIPFNLDNRTTPFPVAPGGGLTNRGDGTWVVQVQATTGCPEIVDSVELNLRVWAVVTNGRGQTTRSAEFTAS